MTNAEMAKVSRSCDIAIAPIKIAPIVMLTRLLLMVASLLVLKAARCCRIEYNAFPCVRLTTIPLPNP